MNILTLDEPLDPKDFSEDGFVDYFSEACDTYISARISGTPKKAAFMIAFGPGQYSDVHFVTRMMHLEANPKLRKLMLTRLENVKISDLWNEKISVTFMVALLNDDSVRDTVKAAITKELNVLAEITITNEHGDTVKAGSHLDDFYQARDAAILEARKDKGGSSVH